MKTVKKKKEKYTERLQIRLAPSEREQLESLARQNGLSISKQIRKLLLEPNMPNPRGEPWGKEGTSDRAEGGFLQPPDQRYSIDREQGIAVDRDLDRRVSMEFHAHNAQLPDFLRETRHLARLEHPNIVAVLDVNRFPGGDFYRTFRFFPEQSLADWIQKDFASGKASQTSLILYTQIIQSVCMSLQYALSEHQGMIHGNLRPRHIHLGEWGEVYVAEFQIPDTTKITEEWRVSMYTAPEILQGASPSHATDQYALGIIFYQILAGSSPFSEQGGPGSLLKQLIEQQPILPPSQQQGCRPDIPPQLEHICMKMLSPSPNQRFSSPQAIHQALQKFLEGQILQVLRQKEAEKIFVEAQQQQAQLLQMFAEVASLGRNIVEQRFVLDPKEGSRSEKRQQLWETEDLYERLWLKIDEQLVHTISYYRQALRDHQDPDKISQNIAALYQNMFLQAEQLEEPRQDNYLQSIRLYHPSMYQQIVEATSVAKFYTKPISASLEIFQYKENRYRHLVPVPVQEPSQTIPSKGLTLKLPLGSYLAIIRPPSPEHREVHCPFVIRRNETTDVSIQIYREEDIGSKDYVFIPAGEFIFGGYKQAGFPAPRRKVNLDDFLISRFPITFAEYLEFLDDIHKQDPDRAKTFIPRPDDAHAPYATLDTDIGKYVPNYDSLWEGKLRERYPVGEGHEWKLPIMGVSWYEALLYCRWRSEREQRRITLPTEEQWEKAAAGVDRRMFPWGNTFDSSACKMGWSRSSAEVEPEPVDCTDFEADASPYRVRGMVGTISEWVLSISPEEADQISTDPSTMQWQRGGGWVATNEIAMHIGTRLPRSAGSRTYNTGFRIVIALRKDKL